MAESELYVSGIGISKNVVSTVVSLAARRVAGVASVGGNDIASSLISVFTSRSLAPSRPWSPPSRTTGLKLVVHVAAFYGYPFTKLAADVREAVADAVTEQIGVEVAAIDVYIDSLVFPKE